MTVTAILPIRKGSERVKNKNFKKFNGIEGGLYSIKIQSLLESKSIDEIIVSTTDETVKKYTPDDSRIRIIERPRELGLSTTRTDDLIRYCLELVKNEWFVWTHVTSPFFTSKCYDDFIETSKVKIENGENDSGVTVNVHKSYFFLENKTPVFSRELAKWPATQTLQPIYEINNAAFIGKTKFLKTKGDRIGDNPFFYETSKLASIDIDWEDDFKLAELLHVGMN